MPVLVVALVCAVVGGLVAGLGPSGTADEAHAAVAKRWWPTPGAVFNDPRGGPVARTRIIGRINDAIRHTPAGGTIRFATYNFDRSDTARYLVNAHRRGVHVQVVVNDNIIGSTERHLQRLLGRNPRASSFFVWCKGSCRSGDGGNLHMKVYSFSRAGGAQDVVISSSSNIGVAAARGQWNDGYTVVGDAGLFATWVRVFDQLKLDRTSSPRRVTYSTTDLQTRFQRKLARAQGGTVSARRIRGDDALARLKQIGCAAPKGYGVGRRTAVRIVMYAWFGDRGKRLARQLAALKRKRCDIKVIGSVIGDPVVDILEHAGIHVRAADWDYGTKTSTSGEDDVFGSRCYSHLKYVTVNGAYAGRGTRLVWTGSENWSSISYYNDEVTFLIRGARVYRRYVDRFNAMWRDHDVTHPAYEKPTRRPC